MQFNKLDGETIEVSANGIIGYITVMESVAAYSASPDDKDIIFDFKAGVNPSLTLSEMAEILAYMEKLQNGEQ